MDENPYKAPREQAGARPSRRQGRGCADLALLFIVAFLVIFLLWLMMPMFY